MIHNPILTGFNPDPSIIRVGEDYYIATSTFEWFPGVQIHHSKDLQNWELIARPLNRSSQLNMIGNPDSCGVWAPCLSYDSGIFYLIYSNVRSFDGVWKDTPNYLVTTQDITGEWSEPIFLDSSGFDASLFHDDDGKKWYASMIVDQRRGKFFGGIILREYDPIQQKLIGEVYHIFPGTGLGCTEAPHIYKKNGYYYLITAEGGTEYEHAVSVARSHSITGPYELHPDNPIITARDHPSAPLQKAGHADIVDTPAGEWYGVFLVGRPLTQRGRCTLGRETAIEQLEWRSDNWLWTKSQSKVPRLSIPLPNGIEKVKDKFAQSHREDFDTTNLSIHFQSLRRPITDEWLSISARRGYLRLMGQESLNSFHFQSLVARRVQAFHIQASTCLEFQPKTFQQMAGLVCYYNTAHWHYLHIMGDESGNRKALQIISCDNYVFTESLQHPIYIPFDARIYLQVIFNRADIQFSYSLDEKTWIEIGPVLDGSILSDDYIQDDKGRYRPAFTGSFVGICCQDLTGHKHYADFDYFEYLEK